MGRSEGWGCGVERERRAPSATMRWSALGLLCVFVGLQLGGSVAAQDAPHGKGLILTPDDELQKIPVVPTFRDWLPEKVDLSRYFPTPGDQRQQGSCVGWAVGYAARAYYEMSKPGAQARNSSRIPSPAYIYNSIIRDGDCSAGSRVNDALSLLQFFGSASLRQYPYDDRSCAKPTADEKAKYDDFRIDSFVRLGEGKGDVLDDIKGELANKNPVILSIQTTPAFEAFRGGAVFERPASYLTRNHNGSHAITAVGYDDSKQAFLLINSWGTEKWGDGGFAWVGYDTLRTELQQAFTMRISARPPPTCELKADPATIIRGEIALLNYSSKNADGGQLDHGLGSIGIGGTQAVSPTQTTDYTATFRGRGGTISCTARVTVQDRPSPPSVASFKADPPTIFVGQSAKLSWSVPGANSVRIEPEIGSVKGTQVAVTPRETTEYILIASNSVGEVRATTKVLVKEPPPAPKPPVIASFEAEPRTLTVGERVRLSWSTSGALSLRIDPTIGTVRGNSVEISPKETTTYTLTASNGAGSVKSTVAITVNQPAPIELPDVGCGNVSISERNGKKVVTGFVGTDDMLENIRLAAPQADVDVRVRPWPQCEALRTLARPLSVPDEPKVSIRRSSADTLEEGETLVFDIETPSYPSYIHVAYIQADGSVLNVVQPGDSSFVAYKPHSKIVIGDDANGRRFRVARPFGREMLIVLASKSPTFPDPRPKKETDREFLTALRRALLYKPDPAAPDRQVAAAYDAIITKERATP